MIVVAVIGLVGGVGIASAQHSGSRGGGGAHGSGQWHSGGGSWQGGNWHGGGGNWHGGGGNWHGGSWHGGSHGSRVFVGVGFGAPWWGWPGYYPLYYPYYGSYGYYPYADYYPYEYAEPTYIEQDTPAYNPPRGGQRSEYSFYCPDPAGYYPQVQTCAKGWLRVVPQSAPGPGAPMQR